MKLNYILFLLLFFIPSFCFCMKWSREQLLALAPPPNNKPLGSVIAESDKPVFERLFDLAHDEYNNAFEQLLANHPEEILNVNSKKCETLFHTATYYHSPKNLVSLLRHAMQHVSDLPNFLNMRDNRGETALHNALKENCPECVRLLLVAGAPITCVKRKRRRKRSAVHLVLSDFKKTPYPYDFNSQKYRQKELKKKKQILQLLYVHGTNFNSKDKKRRTPQQLAERKPGMQELADLIRYRERKAFTAFQECWQNEQQYPPQDLPADIVGVVKNFVFEQDTQPKPAAP